MKKLFLALVCIFGISGTAVHANEVTLEQQKSIAYHKKRASKNLGKAALYVIPTALLFYGNYISNDDFDFSFDLEDGTGYLGLAGVGFIASHLAAALYHSIAYTIQK